MTYLHAVYIVFGICSTLTVWMWSQAREVWRFNTWFFCFAWSAIIATIWPVSVLVVLGLLVAFWWQGKA